MKTFEILRHKLAQKCPVVFEMFDHCLSYDYLNDQDYCN